jgi:hypothetical protein
MRAKVQILSFDRNFISALLRYASKVRDRANCSDQDVLAMRGELGTVLSSFQYNQPLRLLAAGK